METTLNIATGVLDKITDKARARGISRSKMICVLLKRTLDNAPLMVRTGRLVQYQDRRSPGEWHSVHVNFNEVENEFFQDMRKLSKMSLSLLLAYAVSKFLKETLRSKGPDNNRYLVYTLMNERTDSTISWRMVWGKAPPLS
jgi:hypothetical protein